MTDFFGSVPRWRLVGEHRLFDHAIGPVGNQQNVIAINIWLALETTSRHLRYEILIVVAIRQILDVKPMSKVLRDHF